MCDIMFIRLCAAGGEEGEEGEVQEGGEERRHRPEPRLWLAISFTKISAFLTQNMVGKVNN